MPHSREPHSTTLSTESRYWLERQGLRFSPGHLRRCRGVLAELEPAFGGLGIDAFTPELLSRFQAEQLQAGLTPATVNRKTDVITAILNFSLRHRRIALNPSTGFRKLPEVREDMRFWERHEAQAFLRFAAGKYPPDHPRRWVYAVYLLVLNTGIRAGEVWGLQPQDLVQGDELLYIRRQWDLNAKALRLPKGKKARHVPCNETLRGELLRLIEASGARPGQMVFRMPSGRGVSQHFFDDVFRGDVRESGVKPIRFHDLRHTAATLMIAEGLDLKTVQEICGHKDIATTMKYVHLLGDGIRKAARRFTVSA